MRSRAQIVGMGSTRGRGRSVLRLPEPSARYTVAEWACAGPAATQALIVTPTAVALPPTFERTDLVDMMSRIPPLPA